MRHLSSTARFLLLALVALGIFGFTLTSRQPHTPPTPFDRSQMLAEKTGHVDFEVREPHSGRTWWVSPHDYLTPRQAKMMATRPDMIQHLAQTIAHAYRQKGLGDVEVHAAAYASLNGRPSQRLIDFEVDLAQTREELSGTPWVLPLRETTPVRLRAASPRLLPKALP